MNRSVSWKPAEEGTDHITFASPRRAQTRPALVRTGGMVSGERPIGVVAIHRARSAEPAAHDDGVKGQVSNTAQVAIDYAEDDNSLSARQWELREAYAQLSEGQRLSKTGSFTADIRRGQFWWSDEFYRIFEISPLIPARLELIRERIHPDDVRLFDREIQQRMEGIGSEFSFRAVTPKGGLKHLRGVARVMEHIAGRPIFIGTIQDITENKLAEEALNRARRELFHLARVATLNAMSASIAREVSQPLSGIQTNAATCVRMLAADPPDLTGAAETARRTVRDAERASDVIRRLRAMFSTTPPRMEVTDLNSAAREVIALSTAELRRSRAVLETDFAGDLPPVRADRVQLQQVILNLLLNAADAVAAVQNRPRTILIRTDLDADGAVRLDVRDTGIGVGPETVERVFDAFYTTKPEGMGVGLSISRSIIESYNGHLWAEANDGPGATFSFRIPGVAPDHTIMALKDAHPKQASDRCASDPPPRHEGCAHESVVSSHPSG